MKSNKQTLALAALTVALLFAPASFADEALRVGAARVEITLAQSEITGTGMIRDPLYARAIVVNNGDTCAILAAVDQGGLSNDTAATVTTRLSRRVRCPAANIILSGTHTHSGGTANGGLGGAPGEARVADALVQAIEQAASRLAPATVGFGQSTVDLNINRDFRDAQGNWVQGPNPSGPSDKTFRVIDFIGADGRPIAVYMTYAMHPINFFLSGVISADFPGEAARYVERTFDGAVAVFAQGASGDQNPRFLEAPYLIALHSGDDTRQQRVGEPTALGDPPRGRPGMAFGEFPPLPADRLEAYHEEVSRSGQWVSAQGTLLGEHAVDLVRHQINNRADHIEIAGRTTSLRCPGRDRTDGGATRQGALPGYRDGDDVVLALGVLRLGAVYMTWVNGEVYTEIGQRLSRESPQPGTMLVTLANGWTNSGYVYSDAAADHLTFQVIGSRLKPGCAEDRIVENALRLIGQLDD